VHAETEHHETPWRKVPAIVFGLGLVVTDQVPPSFDIINVR
jgi:hypothetical protein